MKINITYILMIVLVTVARSEVMNYVAEGNLEATSSTKSMLENGIS